MRRLVRIWRHRHDAQNQAAALQLFHLAVGANQDGRIVAGIAPGHFAVGGIHHAHKERDEAIARAILTDNAVQTGHHCAQVLRVVKENLRARLQVGH